VCARHGHELMGCKSPVGEPRPMNDKLHRCPSQKQIPCQSIYLTSTTSRGQGQTREEIWTKPKRKTVSRRTQTPKKAFFSKATRHQAPKPSCSGDKLTGAVVRPNEVTKCPWGAVKVHVLSFRMRVLTSGEIC
jgi:hypothetical protein